MSADFDLEHFGDPSEPGAPGHKAWKAAQQGTDTYAEQKAKLSATNAWVEALERAARAIEKPTLDELDETLEEQYDIPEEQYNIPDHLWSPHCDEGCCL